MKTRSFFAILSMLILAGVCPAAETRPPRVFGTQDAVAVTIPASNFSPLGSTTTYADDGVTAFQRYGTVVDAVFLGAGQVPSGALLNYVELDYCDDAAGADVLIEVLETDFLGNINFSLGDFTSSATPGCDFGIVDLLPLSYTVDNLNARLVMRVTTAAGDSTTRFGGVIIAYNLQVSPAPATPTFGDVPDTHPFYQFIEALAASGITGGCGSGNYCPDAPLTRGQMAVFLAKALGLHFP